jgi:hypothetical protein
VSRVRSQPAILPEVISLEMFTGAPVLFGQTMSACPALVAGASAVSVVSA